MAAGRDATQQGMTRKRKSHLQSLSAKIIRGLPKEKKGMHTLLAEKIRADLAAAEEHSVLPMLYL